jgi:reactive intermediate/imine deaminase
LRNPRQGRAFRLREYCVFIYASFMAKKQFSNEYFSLIALFSFLVLAPVGMGGEGRKVIRPPSPGQLSPAGPGLLSPGIIVGDTLFLAGQGSRDPKTGRHPEGFEAQVKQALDNLGAVLKAADLDFSHVAKANVYLTDIKNFSRMNAVYGSYFKSDPPARTTIAVPALPGDSQVEITFVASRARRQVIRPEGLKPLSGAPYSQGIMVGDTLYLSGQGSVDPKTAKLAEGPIEAHVKQTLENCGTILKAAGMDFSNVVSANVYLTDIANFEKMNGVYRSYFKAAPPARTTVSVAALPGEMPVEITLLASRAAKKIIQPEGVRPSPNFSQAVQAGGFLYPAGKVGSGDGIEAQVKSAMDGLGATLRTAGRDFSDVVEAKVYLTDINDYAKMNEVYRSYFKTDPPARTCIAVPKLVGTAKVEVTLVVTAGQTGN